MAHGRYDLTEFEWKTIQPLLPNKPRGVPRVDDRRVLNGIFFILRAGLPWADLPERYTTLEHIPRDVVGRVERPSPSPIIAGGLASIAAKAFVDSLLTRLHPALGAKNENAR